MLNTHMNCIILKIPNSIRTIAMNEEIEANESYAFVYNSVDLRVNYSAPIKTSCCGKLCDRQRVNDWLNIKGCGCYGMSQNSSSLVMQHSISMTTPDSPPRSAIGTRVTEVSGGVAQAGALERQAVVIVVGKKCNYHI